MSGGRLARAGRDILTLPTGAKAQQTLRTLIDSGHPRAPVVDPAGVDDVIAVVHLRD